VRDSIKFGAILMVYTMIAGAGLAFVNIKAMPRIEENKVRAENAARAEVLPDMIGGYELKGEGSAFPYWIGYRDTQKSEPAGYIFIARGPGYSSTIETMVGVDINGKIVGVKILFQRETPGLGAKVEEIRHGDAVPWFTLQFKGKTSSDNIRVAKDDGDIDAITGATISSRTVTNSINRGLVELQKIIGEGL